MPDSDDDDDSDVDDDSDDTGVVDADAGRKGGNEVQTDGSVIINVTVENRFTIPKSLLDKVDVSSTGGSYDFKIGTDTLNKRSEKDGRVRFGKATLGLGDRIKVTANIGDKTFTIEAA